MKNPFQKIIGADERKRIRKMLQYESNLWNKGKKYVAGLDEAGRGPLAGPVVAAAVVFYKNPQISMINDSKKLTAEVREYLFDLILNEALCGIGAAEVGEIDRINIYQASFLAMDRALENLKAQPEHLLVDGRAFPRNDIPFTTIIKGDSLSYSVAAASILAKVTRDRIMSEYDCEFTQY